MNLESVILLPPHGIQLESHRGIVGTRPLFSKRRFIPATSIQDVIINEGLRGWNVLYYLVVVKHTNESNCALEVAYEVQPHVHVSFHMKTDCHYIGPPPMSLNPAKSF